MEIRSWQIFCFFFLVVAATILVFPDRQRMISYYIQSDMFEKADALLEQLQQERPGARQGKRLRRQLFRTRLDRAEKLIRSGSGPAARHDLDALIRDFPREPAPYLLAARLHLNAGREAEARALLRGPASDRVISADADPAYADNLRELIQLCREAEELPTAIRAGRALAASPSATPADQRLLAALYLANGQPRDAFRVFFPVARESRSLPDLSQAMELALQSGTADLMIQATDLAATLPEPDLPLLRRQLALYLAAGRPDKGYPVSREIALRTRTPADVLEMMRVAGYTGRSDLYQAAADRAGELRPDDPAVQLERARVYTGQQRYTAAYATYCHLLDRNMTVNTDLWPLLVEAAHESGKPRLMTDAADRLARHSPGDPLWVHQRVDLYLAAARPDAAIQTLIQATAAHPNILSFRLILARLYEWNNRPLQALAVWAAADHFLAGGRTEDFNPPHYRSVEWHQADLPQNHGDLLTRLIAYYQYNGDTTRMVEAIRRKVRLESPSPDRTALAVLLTETLKELSRRPDLSRDPYLEALIAALYIARNQYRNTLADAEEDPAEAAGFTIQQCLTLFIQTDHLAEGLRFAQKLDQTGRAPFAHRLRLIQMAQWNGLEEEALAALSDLVNEAPREPLLLKHLAETALGAGKPETAFQALMTLAEADPQNRRAHLDRLFALAPALSDPAAAQDAIDLARRLFPDDPGYLQKAADLHLARNDPGRAYPLLRRIAAEGGGRPNAVLKMLEAAGFTGDPAAMRDALTLAHRLQPDHPAVLERCARISLWAERPEVALEAVRHLIEIDGASGERIALLLAAARATGSAPRMREALELARAHRSDDPALLKQLGDLYLELGETEAAKAAYEACLLHDPGNRAVRLQLARLHDFKGPYAAELAALVAEKAASGRRRDLIDAAELAAAYGWYEKAYGLYRRLYARHPADAELADRLVEMARAADRPADAAAILAALSDARPSDERRAQEAGRALVAADRLADALPYLERALALNPEALSLKKDLALYYGWAGQGEKQLRLLEALDRAGQLDPRHRLVMAQVYLDRQDGRNALRLLRPIEAAGAVTPEAGLMLALAYELTHRVDDALRIYRRLGRLYRGRPDLLADLGNRALWLSRTDLALTFYENALKADPDHLAALKGSAQIYAWNNSPAQAIRRFEHYNRLNPYDYEVHYQLGELYFANGRKGDAFKAYDTATRLIKMVKSRRGNRAAGGTP